MKIRLANTAPGWLLCAATSVILVGSANAQTTESRGNPPKTLDTAVQRELNLLLGRNNSANSPTTKTEPRTTTRSRTRPGSSTKSKKPVSLMRRWFGPKKVESVQTTTTATAPKPIQPVAAQPIPTPTLASNPVEIRQTSNQIEPSQQPAKSAIEIELEKLYQQDGRPMPPMNLRSAPNTNFPVPNYKPQSAPAPSASTQASTASQPKRRTIGGFFQKLNPFRKKTQPTKPVVAQTNSPNVAPVRPVAQARPARLPSAVAESVKSPTLPVPPLPQPATNSVATTDVPALKPIQPAKAPAAKGDEFPNPFTEVSESEADSNPAVANTKPATSAGTIKPVAVQPAPAEENPFTGLTLDEPKTKAAPQVASPEPSKINAPGSVGTEIKPIAPNRLPPATIVESPKELPKPNAIETAKAEDKAPAPQKHADKLQRIAARSGMKGLKGFCPVALRDERDLLDTKSEFRSTYGLKTYQFSSAAAKARFDRSPTKYAPAAEGFDVVKLAEDTQDVEGVLDNAVWYKDRLYLFASKSNMQKFVASHADFSI
ncbi:MAG: hypothetical protein O3A00_19590, partial [Planctomycetota bacterium]|nr:hypothetical protein [Planctomycetota bacterium]